MQLADKSQIAPPVVPPNGTVRNVFVVSSSEQSLRPHTHPELKQLPDIDAGIGKHSVNLCLVAAPRASASP
jgi:hypothetical protein